MKFSLIAFAAVFAFSFNSVAQKSIDVQHYKFAIALNDDNDTIYGKATITVKFMEEADQLTLDLTSVKDGKGMLVTSLTENDIETERYQQAEKLVIKLARKTKLGEVSSFIISYKGIPADGLIISKTKYGHRSFFADNWPNRGHNWIPCVDEPGDKATVEYLVTAPQHYQVIANGIMIEETNIAAGKKLTHWKEEVPLPTKVMVIGAADFAVNLSGMVDGCIPVYSWVYPEDRDKGFYDYAQAAAILPYFIKTVGPYGYKKLANVQSKTTYGGLENANAIFYYENSVTGTRKSESLLAHEIAHQWFGDMATEKSFPHIWLSEGFATYMTILYMESIYGNDTAVVMRSEDRRQSVEFAKKSDKPIVDFNSTYMELLNTNSYQKAGWVLHMLRKLLGDDIFYKAVQTYYATYAGKNADTEDLQKIFEKISGKNLSVFFKEWLYSPGLPVLDVKWTYVAKEKKIVLTVKQLQKNLFHFPLELGIKTADGKMQLSTVQAGLQTQTFTIPAKEKPASIRIDPNTNLLYGGSSLATNAN